MLLSLLRRFYAPSSEVVATICLAVQRVMWSPSTCQPCVSSLRCHVVTFNLPAVRVLASLSSAMLADILRRLLGHTGPASKNLRCCRDDWRPCVRH